MCRWWIGPRCVLTRSKIAELILKRPGPAQAWGIPQAQAWGIAWGQAEVMGPRVGGNRSPD